MKLLSRCLISAFSAFLVAAALCFAACAKEITVSPSADVSGDTDYQNIQNALNAAKDSTEATTVKLYKGNYYINKRLVVKGDYTTVSAPQSAVVTQITPGTGIIRNLPKTGGYDDISHLTIDGGTWIGNTAVSGKGYSGFHFSHASDIVIKNAVLKDNFRGHLIEFAGVKNGTVDNCTLGGKYVTNDNSCDEAIQLDVTHNENLVGSLGADESLYDVVFDDTACDNIKITNNNITYSRGIGSHSKIDNHPHKNITISGNKINSTDCGILIYYYYYTKIFGNTITSAGNGITVKTYSAGNFYLANKPGEPRAIKDENNYGLEIYKNSFIGCEKNAVNFSAVKAYPAYYTSIKNNTVSKPGASGIVLDYVFKSAVSGNIISGSTGVSSASPSTGIAVGNGNNNSVSTNTVSYCSDNGIKLSSSSFCSIYGNSISSVGKHGIVLLNGSYSTTVNSNKLSSVGSSGIRVTGGSYNCSVKYNKISKASDRGITADASPGVEISQNTVDAVSGYGIHIYSNSPGCAVTGNKISNIKNNGIQISTGCSSVRLMQNSVLGVKGHGISVYDSTMVYMYKNKISSPQGHGICISKSANAALSSNIISDGRKNGIYFTASPDSNSYSNKISKCRQNGISVYNGGCILQSNKISECKQNGLYLSRSQNSTVVSNSVSKNKLRGIRVTNKSDGIYISSNSVIKNLADGILTDGTSNALIDGNTVSGDVKRCGINILSGKAPRVMSNHISGKYLTAVSLSDSVKAANIKSMVALTAPDKFKAANGDRVKITGTCGKKCTVSINAAGKKYKTKKAKKNKQIFVSKKAIPIKPKSTVLITQTDKAKNTFTKQISVVKK